LAACCTNLLPEPEVNGLLALMLLTEARRQARASVTGDIVLLEDQDRGLWNRELITEGLSRVRQALSAATVGSYTLQAAIAAVHAEAQDFNQTDWRQIAALYDLLLQTQPSPLIELNRAVAIAMRDGPTTGLELIDDLLARGELKNYALVYAARADLCRRLGKVDEARTAYRQALGLTRQEPERRFLEHRLRQLD
jgi:RNA polymerase sigma-70 factor (ECF subfamily)